MPLEPRQDRQDAQDQLPSAPLQDQGHGTQAGFGRRMSGGAGGRSMTSKPFVIALALVAGAGLAAHAQQASPVSTRSEEYTSELQSRLHLVCRLLLEKKKTNCLRHRP